MAKKSRKGKRQSRFSQDYEVLTLDRDTRARKEGPAELSWNVKGLLPLTAGTTNQSRVMSAYSDGQNIAMVGSVGVGKSLVACYLAFNDLLTNDDIHKIVIARSPTPTKDMGFLPGTEAEKQEPYERPYEAVFRKLYGNRKNTYRDLKAKNKVEFVTTAYLRSVTIDNAVIILDEFQNCTWEELHTVCTRLGHNSRLILCGDHGQNDMKKKSDSCYHNFMAVAREMEDFTVVKFTSDDILRSGFVKNWVKACEKVGIL